MIMHIYDIRLEGKEIIYSLETTYVPHIGDIIDYVDREGTQVIGRVARRIWRYASTTEGPYLVQIGIVKS